VNEVNSFIPVWECPRKILVSFFGAFLIGLCLFLQVRVAYSQITPPERDQTYRQAAPGRFDKRFEKEKLPGPTVVPVQPQSLQPIFPEDLKSLEFKLQRLVVQGSTVYKDRQLLPLYRNFLGNKINLTHIYRIANAMTRKYRNDGYILSRVVVPPQKIEKGIVRLQVVEGRIDQVQIKGKVIGAKNLINSYRRGILRSQPLHAKDLERYLLLMEDLPGVSVKSVLLPSEDQSGTSDLTVILENKRFDANLGVDNRGSDFNGPVQIFAGGGINSVGGLNDRLQFQGVVTSETEELLFLRGAYDLPLSKEGTRLFFSAAFSESEPGETLKQFDVEGDSQSYSLRVSHPFIRSRGENLSGHFGFTYKDSETKILGTQDSEDRLRIIDVGVSYDYADRFRGVNLLTLRLSQGLDILDATGSGSPNLSRSSGQSDFFKLSGELARLQQLAPSWNLLGAMSWQYSFDKLLAPEEFGVGGARFGRAYDSSEITGDHGLALKLELQKAIQFRNKYFKSMQAYTFIDYGSVWNRVATAAGRTQENISSAGFGLRYNLKKWVSGYIELAKPINKDVAAEGNRDVRFFFSVSAAF
jgi:hemolysin activation/secretion protein